MQAQQREEKAREDTSRSERGGEEERGQERTEDTRREENRSEKQRREEGRGGSRRVVRYSFVRCVALLDLEGRESSRNKESDLVWAGMSKGGSR